MSKEEIVGICRFSMLGRGDWKAYRRQPDENLEAIYKQKAKELFDPKRIEHRLATFEHLTLRSLAAQSDQDFHFIVVSSDQMPVKYRKRLEELCAAIPQVTLRFFEPIHISEAQRRIFLELGLQYEDCIQFRLDDDDCVAYKFISRVRHHAQAMWQQQAFAISFATQYYCVTDGPTEGIYKWYSPFLGAGALVRHKHKSVFQFAHFQIPKKFLSVVDPAYPNIVTHSGNNDTPRHEAKILKKRGMTPATSAEVRHAHRKHYQFLTKEGLRLCTFDKVVETSAEPPGLPKPKAVKRPEETVKNMIENRPDIEGAPFLNSQSCPGVRLVHAKVLDKLVTFCVPDRRDPIVRHHARGTFYELPELLKLSKIVPKDGVILDIGANIGNHSIFFAMHLGAKKVIPFEPNKAVYDILLSNVIVNGLYDKFDFSYLGVGVSDEKLTGFGVEHRDRNQGAAKMIPDGGDIDVVRIDQELAGEKPVLIKIDVEGMELQALRGIEGLLKESKPILMVEVDNTNDEAFHKWVENNCYTVFATHRRYKLNMNYFLADSVMAETLPTL